MSNQLQMLKKMISCQLKNVQGLHQKNKRGTQDEAGVATKRYKSEKNKGRFIKCLN